MSRSHIPLLSSQSFSEFDPHSFRQHVISLYAKRTLKSEKVKAVRPELSWVLTKTGSVNISLRRTAKEITREEFTKLSADCGLPANELWLRLSKRKIKITA